MASSSSTPSVASVVSELDSEMNESPLKKQRTGDSTAVTSSCSNTSLVPSHDHERVHAKKQPLHAESSAMDVEEEKETSSSHSSASSSSDAASSTASSFAASIPTSVQPSLYRDVIHCIMRFMQFKELSNLTQINSEWKDAVKTLKPVKQGKVKLRTPVSVNGVTEYETSALSPHISSVNIVAWRNLHAATQAMRLAPFTQLESIRGMRLAHQVDTYTNMFPITLTELHAEVIHQSLQPVLSALERVLNLKKLTIILMIGDVFQDADDISPLVHCHQLEELTCVLNFPSNVSDARVVALFNIVRQLPLLRRFHYGHQVAEKELAALSLGTHHFTQLQSLDLHGTFWDEDYAQLSHFPALIQLNSTPGSCEDVEFLRNLTQLVSLNVRFTEVDSDSMPSVENIINCTAGLQNLEKLRIGHPTMSVDDLSTILSRLPLLRELEMAFMNELESLDCLLVGSIPLTLTHLEFEICEQVPSTQLWKLRSLTRLESLIMNNSFGGSLCDLALSLFQVDSPNRIIPTLTHFAHSFDMIDE